MIKYKVHRHTISLVGCACWNEERCSQSVVCSGCRCVITIPGIWKNPGAVYLIFRDIHIPGLFDDLVITKSGILKNHGIHFMLIFGMNSLMLHCI